MKIKLAAASLLAASLASTAVFADLDPKFYVGGEAQYNSFKFKKNVNDNLQSFTNSGKNPISKKSAPGAGLFVGSRLNEYVGLEGGVSASRALKGRWNETNNTGNVKIKNTNLYADVLGYVPVTCDVDLIGSVGMGVLTSKTTGNFNDDGDFGRIRDRSTKAGVRAGAGLQYKFDENLGARLMVRCQKGNKIVKNNTQAGLGLFYQF